MSNKADKVRAALADPAAPRYGSDLVPLVADCLDELEQRAARCRTYEVGAKTERNMLRKRWEQAVKDIRGLMYGILMMTDDNELVPMAEALVPIYGDPTQKPPGGVIVAGGDPANDDKTLGPGPL